MWIVKNELKGRVLFPGLQLEFPPEGEVDLDKIGRDRAESSEQLRLAFENQYLRTIRKTVTLEESELEQMIDGRVAGIRRKLVGEIQRFYSRKGGGDR